MAIAVPNPQELIDEETQVAQSGFITGRGITPDQVKAAEDIRKNYVPVTTKISKSLTAKQAKSFTRLAEDTVVEAARKYNDNPSSVTRADYESAYKDFLNQANEYQKITGNVYETHSVKQDYVGPIKAQGPNVADAADQTAKNEYLTNSAVRTPDDALDQRKWKNAFIPDTTGEYATFYKDPKGGVSDPNTAVPVSFLANQTGNIYQSKDGRPESLNSAVARIALEYQNSGKLNELRSLLIANKFATSKQDIQFLQNMKEFSPNYADEVTRKYIELGVKYATIYNSNVADANTYGKRAFVGYDDFLKSYKGEFNISALENGSGYQSPRYEKNVSINNFDANDIEISVDQMFQKYTGQGADAETAKLIAGKLNAMTPQTTEIRRTGDNSVTTVTGGVTAGDQALAMREQALADPQAENYNKATTFLNYFRDALKAPIQLG